MTFNGYRWSVVLQPVRRGSQGRRRLLSSEPHPQKTMQI